MAEMAETGSYVDLWMKNGLNHSFFTGQRFCNASFLGVTSSRFKTTSTIFIFTGTKFNFKWLYKSVLLLFLWVLWLIYSVSKSLRTSHPNQKKIKVIKSSKLTKVKHLYGLSIEHTSFVSVPSKVWCQRGYHLSSSSRYSNTNDATLKPNSLSMYIKYRQTIKPSTNLKKCELNALKKISSSR